ncbi:amidohydrolase [Candidatus Micrarchaeota archaeon]|nr:amidohydrolase [Candidatus Micrarchaeota archaeon]
MSLLIKNATIVTQNDQRELIDGDILIEGNKIIQIAKNIDAKADIVIDATGKIAIPGLVNTHTHIAMTVFRGYGEDLPLHEWLEKKIWPIEAKQTPEDAGIAAQLAFCEMIRSGTTSFAEMCIHDAKSLFESAEKAGIRGIIAQGILDLGDTSKIPELLNKAKTASEYQTELVHASIAPHAPYTCSEELLIKTKELAKNLKYQIHVSETRKEVFDILKKTGKYPYEYLDSIGLMDANSIFVHGGWLTKKEILLAGKRKITVSHCPISNLKLATGGIAQITELDAAGANVSLGTDSAASNNSLNMFETMKMASLLQKHHYWKADAIPTQKLVDFATRNGAKAIGFDNGSIEKGKLADIVLLERGPNLCPEHDLIANLVYSAGPQNVTDVIIDGKIVMQNKKILTLDEKAAIEKAAELSTEIKNR